MGMEAGNGIAPFVMKIYQMVSDPKTDALITWGRASNSFIVMDPLHFSHSILPAYFKHNNFSSFVRQLNTYGFRKVDPDRWEFASEWFLRGQKHLLKNIIRKKHRSNYSMQHNHEEGGGGDEEIMMEIARLKQEQRTMEEELQGMTKRLEATERRPQQMMEFLNKVVEDPDILPRMMLERQRTNNGLSGKKRRLTISPTSLSQSQSSSSGGPVKSEEEEDGTTTPPGLSNLGFNTFCRSPATLDELSMACLSQRQVTGRPLIAQEPYNFVATVGGFTTASSLPLNVVSGYDSSGGGMAAKSEPTVPPYPFSLLGGGF